MLHKPKVALYVQKKKQGTNIPHYRFFFLLYLL